MSRYIGARYVPLFDGTWDNTKEYEPITVVTYQGDSYTSKKYVPAGVAITNTSYWVKTAEFNQQLANLTTRVSGVEDDVESIELGLYNFDQHFVIKNKIILGDVAINAGFAVNGQVSVAETGYKAFALAGWGITSTAPSSEIHLTALSIGSDNVYYEVTNTGANTKTVTLMVHVLYIAEHVQ